METTQTRLEAVTIKELSKRLGMSVNALLPKIPKRYKLKIGKSARYDINGIFEYFRCKDTTHSDLIDDILK